MAMKHKRIDGKRLGPPDRTGLYDPSFEKDSCGVGFVANIKGVPSHEIMTDAYHINSRMDHRGGCGFEENTGDGAGILTTIPHKFFKRVFSEIDISLPAPLTYSVGNVFLPIDAQERQRVKDKLKQIIEEENQQLLGFREVPIEPKKANVGPAALEAMPCIAQVAIECSKGDEDLFERALYIIRKRFTNEIRGMTELKELAGIYVCSLSSKTIVYKGMLTPAQVFPFFPDLENPEYEAHLAMVHSRFSTNTFPSWDRAQPNRLMSHNGEINTVRGNKNWMKAREGVVESDLFNEKLPLLFPIVEPDFSDSGTFDNILEFLMMSGRSLPEAIMMMVPEAWQADKNMDTPRRSFYQYNSALMEPWDGPASIAFTDGDCIGAVLDRNGLRPSRYYLTHDDKVIMASEVGVLPVAPENVKEKGRLQPGKIFLIDFAEGRLVPDSEVKERFSSARPYQEWQDPTSTLQSLHNPKNPIRTNG